MWNDDNDDILKIYNEMNDEKNISKKKCPICKDHDIHIFFYKYDDKHAGIWLWCSKCHSFSHMYGKAPSWWENPTFIDDDKLCCEPYYLESKKQEIDSWIKKLLIKKGKIIK